MFFTNQKPRRVVFFFLMDDFKTDEDGYVVHPERSCAVWTACALIDDEDLAPLHAALDAREDPWQLNADKRSAGGDPPLRVLHDRWLAPSATPKLRLVLEKCIDVLFTTPSGAYRPLGSSRRSIAVRTCIEIVKHPSVGPSAFADKVMGHMRALGLEDTVLANASF